MVEYKVGDLLLLSSKNLSFRNIPAKLQQKFVGPFEVTEKDRSTGIPIELARHMENS